MCIRDRVHGVGAQIDIDSNSIIMLLEGGLLAARDTNGVIDLNAPLISLNPGSAITAGAEFDDRTGTPVPVLTASGGDIALRAANEMFIGGSVTASGDLVIEAGAPVNPDIDDDDPIYTLYNKAAYFADIAKVDADHYLLQQQDFSLLVTGTITTLADAAALSLSATNDVIIRGNINVNGANGSLQVQSDIWVYIEGFITVQDRITVLGGLTVDGVDLGGADLKGNSVHVHALSLIHI